MDKKEEQDRLDRIALEKKMKEDVEKERLRQRELLKENDLKQLREDQMFSKQIEEIMLKSGVIRYDKPKVDNETELVSSVFKKHKAHKDRQNSMNTGQLTKSMSNLSILADSTRASFNSAFFENASQTQTHLELKLDVGNYEEEILHELLKELKKNKFKRNTKISSYFNPFNINLEEVNTNQIQSLRCINLKEIGAFALAYEINNGKFSLIRELNIKDCLVRNAGMKQILYNLKINNIFSLSTLNISNNYLNKDLNQMFLDIAAINLFQNLEVLNLSNNEFRDDGVDLVIQLILKLLLQNIQRIYLTNNSVTNNGFKSIMKVLIPLQEKHCPRLERLALENNLIDAKTKQEFFPLPSYISV